MIKYFSRSKSDNMHLYRYNDKTNEFYWMDHCWTGQGQWVQGQWPPKFVIVEISEKRAQEISKGIIYTAVLCQK